MYRTDDPIADFNRHDYEQERWLESRPTCSECGEPIITETAYRFNDELICEDCMYEHRIYIEEEI